MRRELFALLAVAMLASVTVAAPPPAAPHMTKVREQICEGGKCSLVPMEGWRKGYVEPKDVKKPWDGWLYYWHAGRMEACFHEADGDYRVRVGDKWGDKQLPPWIKNEPTPAAIEASDDNFGLDTSEIGKRGSYYAINGREVTAADAADAIAGGAADLPQDAHKLRLTVIGDEAQRQRVLADLDGDDALAKLREELVVQAYPPEHWALGCGFVTTGTPGIYLQEPDGHVLHRQDDYAGGPKALAQVIEGVRKRDPLYDPHKDVDLRTGVSGRVSVHYHVLGIVVALAAVAIFAVVAFRKRS